MIDRLGNCVLEFSQTSRDRGMYPWHIQPQSNSKEMGPQELDWKVVFTGTWPECMAELRQREEKDKSNG